MVERMILACRLSIFVCLLSYGCWLSYIPWKVELLDIRYSAFGFALMVFGVGSLISMLVTSHLLLPRFGPRVMGLGVAAFAFALLAWVLSPSYFWFIALAAPFSLCFGVIQPATLAAVTQAEAMSSRRLMPQHWASFSVGSLAGLLAGLVSQALNLPPTLVFLTLFAVTLAAGVLVFITVLAPVTFDLIKSPGIGVPSQNVLFLGGLAALSMATISIVLDWSALWLTRDLGLAIAYGGTGIMAFNLTEIVARLIGERLFDRLGEVWVAGWGVLLGCVVFIAVTLTGNPFLIVAGFGVFGFFSANFVPVLFGIASREETENPVAAVGDVNLIAFAGFLFGPPLVGFIADAISITMCMLILGVTWAVIACILMLSGKLQGRDALAASAQAKTP